MSISRVRDDKLMAPDHTDVQVRNSGQDQQELIGFPEKALRREPRECSGS